MQAGEWHSKDWNGDYRWESRVVRDFMDFKSFAFVPNILLNAFYPRRYCNADPRDTESDATFR